MECAHGTAVHTLNDNRKLICSIDQSRSRSRSVWQMTEPITPQALKVRIDFYYYMSSEFKAKLHLRSTGSISGGAQEMRGRPYRPNSWKINVSEQMCSASRLDIGFIDRIVCTIKSRHIKANEWKFQFIRTRITVYDWFSICT